MSNMIVSNLSYEGEQAKEIFLQSLYESDLKKYGIRYMPGVKGKKQLVTGSVTNPLQAYSCEFAGNSPVTLEETWIEGVPLKVNLEECYDQFWPTFMAEQTEVSLNGGVPQAFQDWFFEKSLIPAIKSEYEYLFWMGDTKQTSTSPTNLLDGIIRKLIGSNAIRKDYVALTVDNILDQVEAVCLEACKSDGNMADYKLFMNYNDARMLKVALGKQNIVQAGVFANFTADGDKVYAYGIEVVPCKIDRGCMVCSPAQNLVLGYDVEDSEVSYKFIDMRETTLDNMFRVASLTNLAAGVIYPSQVVYVASNDYIA